MASCSSWALMSPSRLSRSTWYADVGRHHRVGGPSFSITRLTSPPLICLSCRLLASGFSIDWPSSTLSDATWYGSTSPPTRRRIGSRGRSPRPSPDQTPQYLIRDRDASYGHAVTRRLAAMGIWDRPTAPRSPWQNGHVERLIGSIRRECLDHVVVLNEAHLRRVLAAYASYYNQLRTHRSLAKDTPLRRAVERLGPVTSRPILGGLHHQYCRI